MKFLNFMEKVIDFTACLSKDTVKIIDTGICVITEGVDIVINKIKNIKENSNETDIDNRKL